MPTPGSLPDFVYWPSFPFEGDLRVKKLQDPVETEPPRKGEDANDCIACNADDDAYIWVSERWRVRAMDRPSGLPMVLILETRSHLDLGDLPNLLAAELGVMTVRLEKAIRTLDGVARVHVNRWGDGSAHLHMWFLARPAGRLQLRGTFLSLWDDILPPIPESQWRENLALVAAWLAEFGGRPLAMPPRINWQAPSRLDQMPASSMVAAETPGSTSDTVPTTHWPASKPKEVAGAADAPAPSGVGEEREPGGSSRTTSGEAGGRTDGGPADDSDVAGKARGDAPPADGTAAADAGAAGNTAPTGDAAPAVGDASQEDARSSRESDPTGGPRSDDGPASGNRASTTDGARQPA